MSAWALCGFGRRAEEQQWGEIGGVVIWKNTFPEPASKQLTQFLDSKRTFALTGNPVTIVSMAPAPFCFWLRQPQCLQAQVRGKREVGPGQTIEDNHGQINGENEIRLPIPENTRQIEELAADTQQKFMLVFSSAIFGTGKVPGNLALFTLIFQATLSCWLVSSVTTRRTSSTRTFKNIRMALQQMVS